MNVHAIMKIFLNRGIKEVFSDLKGSIQRLTNRSRQICRNTDELVWAEVFNSAIRDSEWFRTSVSPGRWAVGFPYLYVMYRVLDEMRPGMILEMGTGQTTRMIADYLGWNGEAVHIAVEQDEDWAGYIKHNVDVDRSDLLVIQAKLMSETVNGNDVQITRYSGFREKIAETVKKHGNRRINFVSVDGPSTLSGQTKGVSSRRDVLELIPEMMADEFVILIDDIDRDVNRKLVLEIKDRSAAAGIPTVSGEYWGQKGMAVVASEGLRWYTSL